MNDVHIAVLAPPNGGGTSHMGTLAAPSFTEDDPEGLFEFLVSHPEVTVAGLIGDESWPETQAAIVTALSTATDKAAKNAAKLRIPAIVPARFEDTRRARSSCLGRQVVMHDFDGVEGGTFEDACDVIRARLPDRWLAIHTTASERDEKGWRLRAIEILDREANPEEWETKVKPHMRALGGDGQALDITRLLFMPVRTPGYAWKVYKGARTRLDGLAHYSPKTESQPREATAGAPDYEARIDAAARLLGDAWPTEGRHGAQLALAGGLARDGWRKARALDFLCAVCRRAGNEERSKREQTIQRTYRLHEAGQPVAGWTALESHLDAGIISAARGLLDADADARRELQPKAEPAPPASDDPIKWGGWDALQTPPVYLLEGIIPEAKVVTFFAEGGSVKTWSALALAISVATGERWLGAYGVKTGKALYLDYEDGPYEFHRRVRYLTGGKDVPGLGYRYCGPQIADPDYWIWLGEYAKTHGIELVIFDSISASMPGDADENVPAFSQGVKLAGRFTEAAGTTVVFIHHANKSGGMRGTTAIRDHSDVVFKFVPVSETDDVKRMRLECDKPGPQKRPAPVNIELNDKGLCLFKDEAQEAARNATSDEGLRQSVYLAIVNGVQIRDVGKYAKAIKHRKEDVTAALNDLKAEYLIAKVGAYYVPDSDELRTKRVLEQLDSDKAFATQSEIAKHATVDPLFVDGLRLRGVICQSQDGRWMRIDRSRDANRERSGNGLGNGVPEIGNGGNDRAVS